MDFLTISGMCGDESSSTTCLDAGDWLAYEPGHYTYQYKRPDQAPGKQSEVQDVGNQGKGDCSVMDSVDNLSMSRRQLIADQESVNQLGKFAVDEVEADLQAQCFYLKSSVLMRKWRPRNAPADEEWQVIHQIVVPRKYQGEILSLAHKSPIAGYLGVNKTYFRILNNF